MIRFTLACDMGHKFEGWFSGSDAFEAQRSGGTVLCPVCGSAAVDKALMAPAVATSRKHERLPVVAHAGPEPERLSALRKLREDLVASAENVGERFAEEARRIHYNEVDQRGIYGKASIEEVRSLVDEGIAFHPLPILPEDHN